MQRQRNDEKIVSFKIRHLLLIVGARMSITKRGGKSICGMPSSQAAYMLLKVENDRDNLRHKQLPSSLFLKMCCQPQTTSHSQCSHSSADRKCSWDKQNQALNSGQTQGLHLANMTYCKQVSYNCIVTRGYGEGARRTWREE